MAKTSKKDTIVYQSPRRGLRDKKSLMKLTTLCMYQSPGRGLRAEDIFFLKMAE